MKFEGIRLAILSLAGALALAAQNPELQQKAAAAKEAAARNQQALQSYSWISKTELSFKGEVKNTKIESCRYGADGKVQKTELTEPPEPPKRQRGLKGRVIAKKTGEMKKELEEAAALIHSYIPPTAERIQAAIAAGKLSLTPGPDSTAIRISDYEKTGDALALTLDPESKTMRRIAVDTWLEKPEETVSLEVDFQSIPGGPHYPAAATLTIPAKQIEVWIENGNYQKLAP